MKFRTAALGLMALAIGLLVTSTTRAAKAERDLDGLLVSAGDGKLVVTDKKSGTDISYIVHPTCPVVMEGGEKGKLDDLRKGDHVSFHLDMDDKVVSIKIWRAAK